MQKYITQLVSYLVFSLLISQTTVSSEISFNQNPSKSDSSFFIISAIKTVSGEEPEEEFFDINIKFQYSKKVFAFASLDVALSTTDTDSVRSSSDKLSEAGLSLNYSFYTHENSVNPQRQLFAGPQVKIFDTITYIGLHVGSIELNTSIFHTTYSSFGYLYRFFEVDRIQNATSDLKEHRHNLYAEFGIRSDKVPVIDALRIKAGILIPTWFFNDDPEPVAGDIKTRIVIEIPIKGVHSF